MNSAFPSSVVQIPAFCSIRLTGADRAKFLHNFCTSQIRELPPGQFVEAFFCDVRARVLAHGWILAADHFHEIRMLPGDEEFLYRHLSRYVISEDVTVERFPCSLPSSAPSHSALALIGPKSRELPAASVEGTPANNAAATSVPADGQWRQIRFRASNAGEAAVTAIGLSMQMAGIPIELLVPSFPGDAASPDHDNEATASAWQSLPDELAASGWMLAPPAEFERLRILERLPKIGVDLTSDHMAPEADRNAQAINYKKGCYLGQEPIARLDAMGHINRALRALRTPAPTELLIGASVHHQGTPIGTITSACPDSEISQDSASLALGMIRIHGLDLTSGITLTIADGSTIPGHVLP